LSFFNTNRNQPNEPESIPSVTATAALVDTSVIIDGRIADIARVGFAPGQLLIPRFVLAELQLIADSGDGMKRSRGRRGLEMLHGMRQDGIDMEIIEDDYDDIKEVDAKLVRLGRKLGVTVLTTDYNLNRVASIEGVRVLNINELANAVRPVVLPGEHMMVRVVQAGKERGQGVGYLADGTMIVVDNGDKMIGQEVETEITRVFQTVAGKMLFAAAVGRPNGKSGKAPAHREMTTPSSQDLKPLPGLNATPAKSESNQSDRPKRSRNRNNRDSRAERPTATQSKPEDNRSAGANRRPKRLSPTQKLENSLVELTGGNTDPSDQ
jgi:rRNA-processing protein FCF1